MSFLQTVYWRPILNKHREDGFIFNHGNVGDELQRFINYKLFNLDTINAFHLKSNRFFGCGSIAHRINKNDIIWGSGIKKQSFMLSAENSKTIKSFGVRGPLTRKILAQKRIQSPDFFFDPGLYIEKIFETEIKEIKKNIYQKHKISIVPHYSEYHYLKKNYFNKFNFLSVDLPFLEFIKSLLESDLVISSSLHGVIFCEALDIPVIVLKPSGEDFFKFEDYFYGTERYNIKFLNNLEEGYINKFNKKPYKNNSLFEKTIPSIDFLKKKKIINEDLNSKLNNQIIINKLIIKKNQNYRFCFSASKDLNYLCIQFYGKGEIVIALVCEEINLNLKFNLKINFRNFHKISLKEYDIDFNIISFNVDITVTDFGLAYFHKFYLM